MEKMNDFVQIFVQQLEDVEPSSVTGDTKFHNLEGWDSLSVLGIQSAIKINYGVSLSGLDINECETIAEVFSLVEQANTES